MRILDRAGRIAEGSVYFTGLDVRDASEDDMRNLRGREMSMIFQNPRAALNPIRKVGRQIEDVLVQHAQVDSAMLAEQAIEILDQVRSRDRASAIMPIRSSCRAACASASSSRSRSPAGRSC